jgi:hypothetical protein
VCARVFTSPDFGDGLGDEGCGEARFFGDGHRTIVRALGGWYEGRGLLRRDRPQADRPRL